MRSLGYIIIAGSLGIAGCCDGDKSNAAKQAAEAAKPPAAQAVTVPVTPAKQAPLKEFAAEVLTTAKLESLKPAETVTVPVTVKNTGKENWPPPADKPINFAYHWLDETGQKMIVQDGIRTALPQGLAAGGQINLQAQVQAPDQPGKYILRLTLVQEIVAWFEDKGMKPLDLTVTVQ
jgi:hypothetical protein